MRRLALLFLAAAATIIAGISLALPAPVRAEADSVCGQWVERKGQAAVMERYWYFFVLYGIKEEWAIDPGLVSKNQALIGHYVSLTGPRFDARGCDFPQLRCLVGFDSAKTVTSCEQATATPVLPTATLALPTPTRAAPTTTPVVPTATRVVPTATRVVPTATRVVPTATPSRGLVLVDASIKLQTGAKLGDDVDVTRVFMYEANWSTTALRADTIWLRVVNQGPDFHPPVGGAHYAVRVALKQNGQELSSQSFSSRDGRLFPIHGVRQGSAALLGPITLRLSRQALREATIDISFLPDASLGMPGSVVTKGLSVAGMSEYDASDCAVGSMAVVLKPLVGDLSDSVPGRLLDPILAVTVACNRSDWVACATNEFASWAAKAWVTVLKGSLSKVISAIVEAVATVRDQEEMYQSLGVKGCFETAAWFNAILEQPLTNSERVNGVLSQSPVYPLVTGASGARAGFLTDGRVVQELPDSRAAQLGEQRLVIYPARGEARVDVFGYQAGSMNLYVTSAQETDDTTELAYKNVRVTQGMKGSVDWSDSGRALQIDDNADGRVDRSTAAVVVTSGMTPAPTQVRVATTAPTPRLPTQTPPPAPGSGGICGGAIALGVAGMVVACARTKARNG